eukprot:g30269.t1
MQTCLGRGVQLTADLVPVTFNCQCPPPPCPGHDHPPELGPSRVSSSCCWASGPAADWLLSHFGGTGFPPLAAALPLPEREQRERDREQRERIRTGSGNSGRGSGPGPGAAGEDPDRDREQRERIRTETGSSGTGSGPGADSIRSRSIGERTRN